MSNTTIDTAALATIDTEGFNDLVNMCERVPVMSLDSSTDALDFISLKRIQGGAGEKLRDTSFNRAALCKCLPFINIGSIKGDQEADTMEKLLRYTHQVKPWANMTTDEHMSNNQYNVTMTVLDLQSDIKEAYTNVKLMKQMLDTKQAAGPIPVTFLEKVSAAYDEYDILVDRLIESTDGNASAANTDPLTYNTMGYTDGNMTYNDMAEAEGDKAFGE